MEKPPVLSDEEIKKAVGKFYSGGSNGLVRVAQAQRDADWEHEQETAREIFKEIEKKDRHSRFGFEDGTLLVYKEDYESIKSRHLEGK